jgi:2'-5' RNA ligase
MKELPLKRILFASLVMLAACATTTPSPDTFERGTQVFNAPSTTEKAEFIPHTEEKPMKAYLAMNLPYAPYKSLYEQIQDAEKIQLNTRGEAHITVVTPVEYDKVLKKHMSIAEITKIAEEAKIQDLNFNPVCIGRGEKELSGKPEKVYYVVVESSDLIDLRGKIEEAYVKNGGKPQEFVPEKFLPHVTLGYTARDLHIEDGVTKNKNSCIHQFQPQTQPAK